MDMAAHIRNANKEFQRFGIKFPEELWITKFCKALGSEYSQFIMNFLSARVIAHFDKNDKTDNTPRVSFDDLAFQAEAEEGRLKTYPAQASAFLSTIKTGKNVPQILDVDGDTTGSPTATSYTQRRNPKGIPKIGPDSTPKMMISIWERYMASWLTISIPTAYSRQ